MLLAVDIGNTQTVVGCYDSLASEQPRTMWRLSTCKQDTADDVRVKLEGLLAAEGLGGQARHGVACSVVPPLGRSWEAALERVCAARAWSCTAEAAMACGLFEADYPRPAEVGADRVADAIAAKALLGAPVVVVDFGTATNVEVIGADGRFLGGIIAPGAETGAAALFSHATRLSAIDLEVPAHVIGRSTEEAMASGIVVGEAARIDGLLERVFAELGYRAPVVATGGLAPLVSRCSSLIDRTVPELTLEGLRRFAAAVAS